MEKAALASRLSYTLSLDLRYQPDIFSSDNRDGNFYN